MLKSLKPYLLVVILSLVFTTISFNNAHSQPPPPPPGGTPGSGGHNLNANQGAPLGEGIWILITLAFSYGLNRHMRNREQKVELVAPRHSGSSASGNDFLQPAAKNRENLLAALTGFFYKHLLPPRKSL